MNITLLEEQLNILNERNYRHNQERQQDYLEKTPILKRERDNPLLRLLQDISRELYAYCYEYVLEQGASDTVQLKRSEDFTRWQISKGSYPVEVVEIKSDPLGFRLKHAHQYENLELTVDRTIKRLTSFLCYNVYVNPAGSCYSDKYAYYRDTCYDKIKKELSELPSVQYFYEHQEKFLYHHKQFYEYYYVYLSKKTLDTIRDIMVREYPDAKFKLSSRGVRGWNNFIALNMWGPEHCTYSVYFEKYTGDKYKIKVRRFENGKTYNTATFYPLCLNKDTKSYTDILSDICTESILQEYDEHDDRMNIKEFTQAVMDGKINLEEYTYENLTREK